MTEADKERVAIAGWLRKHPLADDYDFGPGMEMAAKFIERGDHHKRELRNEHTSGR